MLSLSRLFLAALAGLTIVVAAHSGRAQEIQRIVAIINDDIISGYDLQQRIALTIAMSGFPNNKQVRQQLARQSVQALINDSLKMQEAAKYNINISDDEMNAALANVERRNKIEPGRSESFLNSRRVELDSLLYQIRASLSWRKILGRRVAPKINITKEEVASVRQTLEKNRGKNEYFLSEIFVPVETRAQEANVRETVNGLLTQLKKGAPFGRLALQFSQGPSAAAGGRVGWVLPEDLAPELAAALSATGNRSVSEPVRTHEGYYILGVENIRKVLDFDPLDTNMQLTQFIVPRKVENIKDSESKQKILASSVSRFIDGCRPLAELTRELAYAGTGNLGRIRLGDMPEKFQSVVKNIPDGKASPPMVDGKNYLIFAVCDKKEAKAQLGTDEDIRRGLITQRVNNRAERYLKDLRQSATIEIR